MQVLGKGWQLGVGRDATDVAVLVLCRRCGPGWSKLNQCQCTDLFSKAEGWVKWDGPKSSKKLDVESETTVSEESFLGCSPQNDIYEWPNQDSQKALRVITFQNGHCQAPQQLPLNLQPKQRSCQSLLRCQCWSTVSWSTSNDAGNQTENATLGHSHSDVMVRQAWCFSMSYCHTGMKCEARVEFVKSNHCMARVADLDA